MIWGNVHAGDTVRGADGKPWVVCERHAGLAWLGSGVETARFVLQCGERRIEITRELIDDVPIVSAPSHMLMASAVGAVFAAWPDARFVEETLMPKAEIHLQLPDDCPHPSDARSVLKGGVVRCTACGTNSIDGHEVDAEEARLTIAEAAPRDPFATPEAALAVAPDEPSIVATATDRDGRGELFALGDAAAAVVDQFAMPAAVAPPRRIEAPKGKWGWYKLPHPTTGEPGALFPRVSTIKSTLADRYGIERWDKRNVAKGVAISPDLIAGLIAADLETDKETINGYVESAKERARALARANFGTAMHKFAERLDDGETIGGIGVPDNLRADLEAYARVLKAAGLRVIPELSERVIVNTTLGYAGRWDRIVEDRAGRRRVLDLKTGDDVLEYAGLENAAQQAGYNHGEYLATLDFTGYEPMPLLDQDVALILHLPLGKGEAHIYGIDTIRGWRTFRQSVMVRADRSEARDGGWMWTYEPGGPSEALDLRIGRASTLDELMEGMAQARDMGLWTPDREAYALARYDHIRAVTATTPDELAALFDELGHTPRWTPEVAAAASETFARINANQHALA